MMANGVVLNVTRAARRIAAASIDRSTIPSEESQRSVTVMRGWHGVDLIHAGHHPDENDAERHAEK